MSCSGHVGLSPQTITKAAFCLGKGAVSRVQDETQLQSAQSLEGTKIMCLIAKLKSISAKVRYLNYLTSLINASHRRCVHHANSPYFSYLRESHDKLIDQFNAEKFFFQREKRYF